MGIEEAEIALSKALSIEAERICRIRNGFETSPRMAVNPRIAIASDYEPVRK